MAHNTAEKRRAYRATPEGRASLRAAQRRYNNSALGKAAKARDLSRPEGYAKHRARIAAAGRFAKTGVSQQMFADLLLLQGQKCAVCGNGFKSTRDTHADHDHTTKTPRGLLCSKCNFAEGLIRSLGLTPLGFGERLQRYVDNPPAEMLALI